MYICVVPGPMVYGAAYCPLVKKEEVKELGVAGNKFHSTIVPVLLF